MSSHWNSRVTAAWTRKLPAASVVNETAKSADDGRSGRRQTSAPANRNARFDQALSGCCTASRDASDPLAEMTSADGQGVIHAQRLGAASREHDGSAPGFYAALVVVPERDVVVALATNGGNEAAGEVNAFTGIVDGVDRAVPSPP